MLSMLTVNLLGDVATFEGAPLTDGEAKAIGKQLAEQNVQVSIGIKKQAELLAVQLASYSPQDISKIVTAYREAKGSEVILVQALKILKIKEGSSKTAIIYGVLSTISMAASVYHGYRRNNSLRWALGWGLLGGLFPVITPTIALAQGFGKPKR